MSHRRYIPILAALGLLAACTPDISQRTNPQTVTYAAFDPAATPPVIPLPNDIARANVAATSGAQQELLNAFNQAGGFPNDQELPVTVDFFTEAVTTAPRAKTAPDLDLATIKTAPGAGATLAVFQVGNNCTAAAGCQAMTPVPVPIDPITAANYVKLADHGTLSIFPAKGATGARRWPAGGKYVVAIRGGASGVKTADGKAIQPQAAMYLLLQDKDLSLPINQGLLLQQYPDPKVAASFGTQLEAIRKPLVPAFGLLDAVGIPHREIAIITGFTVAPKTSEFVIADPTAATVSPNAAVMPFPSDYLIDPATKKVLPLSIFCGGHFDVGTTTCATAQGLATLDGFSTTAAITASLSGPVRANSVKSGTVLLFELPATGTPRQLVDLTLAGPNAPPEYVSQPPPLTGQLATPTSTTPTGPCSPPYNDLCITTTIGLQPAVPVAVPGAQISLPPLKEATQYLVVITTDVVSAAGHPLQPSSLGRVVTFKNPVSLAGKSQLPGVSDTQAALVEQVRINTRRALDANLVSAARVAMAYTFTTQSITQTSLDLVKAPYANPAAIVAGTAADITSVFQASGAPALGVAKVYQVPVKTVDKVDLATGSLSATQNTLKDLNALVTVPDVSLIPALASALTSAPACAADATKKCLPLPLVLFHHGITRQKTDMFAMASALSQAGFVVAAIDMPLHGERAYCTTVADCICTGVGTCTATCTNFPAGAQGDATPAGLCTAGSVPDLEVGVATPTKHVSGRYFVTTNFFRTRDALRQDILDHSALMLALAPATPSTGDLATKLAASNVSIDRTKIYWVGQSLGGVAGTLNAAVNPDIKKAVLNVPGGTLVDVFSDPAGVFFPQLRALLIAPPLSVDPLDPTKAAQYGQILTVAKWILDPAEPLNYGRYVIGSGGKTGLKNPFTQADVPSKQVLGQYAVCDDTIQNRYNLELFDQIGVKQGDATNPLIPYFAPSASSIRPVCGGSPIAGRHGFILSPTTQTAAAQGHAAAFLAGALTTPPTANP